MFGSSGLSHTAFRVGPSNATFAGFPATANNVVGVFELTASLDEAVLNATSITNDSPGASGTSAARLFASADATLDVGSDIELGSIAVDNANAPATFDFTALSEEIASTATYLILTINVDAGAPGDDILFSLTDKSALTTPDGAIATVNGQSQTSFTSLPLSNASTALSVELVTFEATPENGSVQLRWATASETGNAGFDVQRRLETSPWSTVQRVAGAGTTTKQTTYRFVDETLPYETASVAYRLCQVDVDGAESFSSTRSVEFARPDRIELLGTSPNPASGEITVRFAVPQRLSSGQLTLFDMLGREVRAIAVENGGSQKTTMSVRDLAPGVYVLRLTAGGNVRAQKLTVVR